MKCRNKARPYEESVWRSLHCNGVLGHYGGGFQKSTISLSEFFLLQRLDQSAPAYEHVSTGMANDHVIHSISHSTSQPPALIFTSEAYESGFL